MGSNPATPTIKIRRTVLFFIFLLTRELKHLTQPSKENSNSSQLFSGRRLAPRETGALSAIPDHDELLNKSSSLAWFTVRPRTAIKTGMSAGTFFQHIKQSFYNAWRVVRRSIGIIKNDPQILIYPYLAIIFILISYPVVGRFVLSMWHRVDHPAIVTKADQAAPHVLFAHLGLVTFSVFYTLFVTSYFTCMISASAWVELEGKPTSPLYGLRVVGRRFLRVSRFAVLAIFFFPMGIIAQHKKFKSPHGAFEAISSSFSLSMSQLAPEVVNGDKGVFKTLGQSVDTLGQLWRESLVIRISMFFGILALGSISLLPKLIEHYWFNDDAAHVIGWIVAVFLGATSYVLLRVIGAVFTTTLYFEAKSKK